jgi:acyl-CoA reductase-like NAD-dependent aldehyde dehydrogenase
MNLTPSQGGNVPIRHPDCLFIDGKWVKPSGDRRIKVVTPSTEELFVQVAEAEAADVNRAVAAARNAFDTGPWPRLSHAERADYLRRIARCVAACSGNLGHVWISEVGVVQSVAQSIAPAVAGIYDYYASLAETFPFVERHTPEAGNLGLLVREPVGVVGAIVPWNGALSLIGYKIAPALLAGCTVIVKSSPESPGAALIMAEIAEEIGLPSGVLNVITADREVSELLVRHPDVDKITFTGSSAAGKKIAAICGERIARCTLELGGKSAAVILDDYDLETAARSITASAGLLCGQVCSSLTRLVVSRHRHDAFVDALSASFQNVKVGDPFAESTEMGPLAMQRQRDRVEGYIAKGCAAGATLATGGKRPPHLDR